jgi:hypothetical protein
VIVLRSGIVAIWMVGARGELCVRSLEIQAWTAGWVDGLGHGARFGAETWIWAMVGGASAGKAGRMGIALEGAPAIFRDIHHFSVIY